MPQECCLGCRGSLASSVQHIRDWRSPYGEIACLKYAQVAGSWQGLVFAKEAMWRRVTDAQGHAEALWSGAQNCSIPSLILAHYWCLASPELFCRGWAWCWGSAVTSLPSCTMSLLLPWHYRVFIDIGHLPRQLPALQLRQQGTGIFH